MSHRAKKILVALFIAFGIVLFLSKTFFVKDTPRPNKKMILSVPSRIISFVKTLSKQENRPKGDRPLVEKPTLTLMPPTPTEILSLPIISSKPKTSPTTIPPTNKPIPTKTIRVSKTPSPTLKPTIKPTVSPTPSTGSFAGCPTTSNQSYSAMGAEHNPSDLLIGPADQSPEINLRLRGFTEVNEGTGFIGRGGDMYGLDDQMPPQISSLYGGPVPKIIKTYRIYEWDFDSKKSGAPNTATPNFKVHMIGLAATPGQPLVGLKAGRSIGGGNVFMTLYATKTDIVFTHSNSDTLMGGYLFFFLDICVDPNLLAAYQSADAAGRGSLPVIATGQVFGYAGNTDVKVSIRDTMSFMDERYNEDWWTYGQ
jgi:hypothetical protein